mgnify:CR=1 FL=1
MFSLMYVPNQIMDWENASVTLENLKNNEFIFKLSIVSGILMALTFLMLAYVLYRLFFQVNNTMARLLLIFVAISVGFSFSNMTHKLDILTLLNKPQYLSGVDLETQIMLHFESYGNGILVNSVFWGLWLFPFGYLVFRSGFLPKLLGSFLMLGFLGYLTEFAGPLLMEGYYGSFLSEYIGIPGMIGEFGICLWMLIMGDRNGLRRLD